MSNHWTEAVIVLLVLTSFKLLGSSRLGACIRAVAVQGIALGALTLLAHVEALSVRSVALAVVSMALKGAVFPWLMFRALREAGVRREVEPFVGYTTSLVIGAATLGMSFWIGSRLPLPVVTFSSLAIPAALFTVLMGLFVIVSRRVAINQVLGYLVLENGVFAFGLALAQVAPLWVELGILLDVFVAVFVMGIAIFHISREFDHIETDRLTNLKD